MFRRCSGARSAAVSHTRNWLAFIADDADDAGTGVRDAAPVC